MREERDDDLVAERLADLEEAARSDENLMPYLITAVESYATLGEMAEAMKKVFGEHEQ